MRKRALDLGDELATIRRAVEGVRLLTENATLDRAPDEETAIAAHGYATAVADLIVERLRQVERAVRSTADPETLVAAHNRAVGHGDGAVRLSPWSAERRQEEREREARRAKFEARATRRRRP